MKKKKSPKKDKKKLILRLFSWLKKTLPKVFGDVSVSYKPPQWISRLKKELVNAFKTLKKEIINIKKQKPFGFWAPIVIVAGVVILIFALPFVLSFFPEPVYTEVRVKEPVTTHLDEDAKPYPLILEFNRSAAHIELADKILSTGVSIEPEIEGTWQWENDARLVFTPQFEWPIGQHYTIRIEKTILSAETNLRSYEFSFDTPPFTANIVKSEFYIDPTNQNNKQVLLTIRFSHPVNTKEFETSISLAPSDNKDLPANIKDKDYAFTVKYDESYTKAYILSENIPLPNKTFRMKYTIENTFQAQRGSDPIDKEITAGIKVPGKYDFAQIQSINLQIVRNVNNEMDQVLVINSKGDCSNLDILKNISIYLLPKDSPERPGIKAEEDHRWHFEEIDQYILSQSRKITPIAIPKERDYTSLTSLKINVATERYLYVKLNRNTKVYGGYLLKNEYNIILSVPKFPKLLKILNEGAILSLSGEKKLSLMAHDVGMVQFEIGRILPDQINHLISQSSGDISNPYFRNYRFNKENIAEFFTETRELRVLEPGKIQYFSFDFSRYLNRGTDPRLKYGLFFFRISEYNPHPQEENDEMYDPYGDMYGQTLQDTRLILVTDLGFLVKQQADKSKEVFVQTISTGNPGMGAQVQVLGKNGIPVFTQYTDENGHAHIPALTGYEKEKAPIAYVIKSGNDFSFMPYKGAGRTLNYSKFAVGGVHGASDPNQLDAYLFSNRGIYRPGDTIHIAMIIKTRNWQSSLPRLPLEALISDPRGREIHKQKLTVSPYGMEELTYKTQDTFLTGLYKIDLYIIKDDKERSLIGSTSVQVEEFLPDRMNIISRFVEVKNRAWIPHDEVKAEVTLKNLFGTPARGNKIEAKILLAPHFLSFRKFNTYAFFNPEQTDKHFEKNIPDQTTDEQGIATYDINLSQFEKATYLLRLMVDGFEKQSGRRVSTESSIVVSSLPFLVGYKADGDLSYIYHNSSRNLNLIAINPQLEKIAVKGLTFTINELRYVSILTKKENDTYAYKSVLKTIQVIQKKTNIQSWGLNYALPTSQPGDYELVVTNSENNELCKVKFSVIGRGNIARGLEKNAELEIKLNKTDYAPYEEIQVYINAPYVGAGLITIEQDKVYTYKWFKTSTTSSIQTIQVPAHLEGNGYVCVSFIRDLYSKEIYMSPLSYAAAPFTVSRARRTNKINLSVAGKARPGKPFRIRYNAARPGKIIVFAVDEGILQVARYKTPSPLDHFFRKRALEVNTQQILDLILPEYSIMRSLSAMGGGGPGEQAIAKNLNPFKRKRQKPVVYWSGIVNVDSSTRELWYDVPDYFNGTLRVMAVAVSTDTIGVASKTALIQDDFIISPNTPLFALPGDEFIAAVNVTNNLKTEAASNQVDITLAPSTHFELLEGASKKLTIKQGYDETAYFKIKVKQQLGGAEIKFTASSGGHSSSLTSYMSVRPPTPYRTTLFSGHIKKDDIEIPLERGLHDEFKKHEVTVSFLPLGMVRGLKSYLDDFPYICTEQIVSQGFPSLLLKDIREFKISPAAIRENFDNIIKVLQVRQNSEGAFGVYAANDFTIDFFTIYALHYLTEAKLKGYTVPKALFDKGLEYLEDIGARLIDYDSVTAVQKVRGMYYKADMSKDAIATAILRDRAYALYVLTRNGIRTTKYINKVRDECDKIKGFYNDCAAPFLAATYMLLKQTDEAEYILHKTKILPVEKDSELCYDNLFMQCAYLYIMSKHFPARLDAVSSTVLTNITNEIYSNNYNTLSSSFAALALSSYVKTAGSPSGSGVRVYEVITQDKIPELSIPAGLYPVIAYSDKAKKIRIVNEKTINLFYQVIQTGFDRKLPQYPIIKGIQIYKEYTDGEGNDVDEVAIGDEIEVHIKIRSIGTNDVNNIAIVDMLPGGFEVVLDTVRKEEGTTLDVDYIDAREDRVVIYGLARNRITQYVYKIRAVTKGKYMTPPVFTEAMYNKDIWSLSGHGILTIKD
jgi:uncharacterized repeat protein (TIGR01451 family)